MSDAKQSFMVNDSHHYLVPPPPDQEGESFMHFPGSFQNSRAEDPANEDTDDERPQFLKKPKKLAMAQTITGRDTAGTKGDYNEISSRPISEISETKREFPYYDQITESRRKMLPTTTKREPERLSSYEITDEDRMILNRVKKRHLNIQKSMTWLSSKEVEKEDTNPMGGMFACNVVKEIPRHHFTKKKPPPDILGYQLQKSLRSKKTMFSEDQKEGGQEYNEMSNPKEESDYQRQMTEQMVNSLIDNGDQLNNYDADLDNQSIDPLTLREGYDYDDARQKVQYPDGYNESDDLNKDGVIDHMEHTLKVINRKDEIREQMDEKIKKEYLNKFRKEVDFHHKVAFRFEKCYRLSKKQPEKRNTLNLEIIEIISEHSDYIEQDPLSLFYCLYFCIYYNNPDLVEFLRTLIQKMNQQSSHEKISQLLELIDINGIQRIRTIGEQINVHVYHMVFYQAVNDDLRLVYTQILKQLKFIQLRDSDAEHFLLQRDYELIKLSFSRFTTKINLQMFFKKTFTMKANHYRKYNEAFYEEILIDYAVEPRVAKNYRERFLIKEEQIKLVLEMYSKNDYVNNFLNINYPISHSDYVELFCICLRSDSFKIAMQIYLKHLSNSDITIKIMDIMIGSIKGSQKYHEMKLFFIHQYFDILTIQQLNQLVDIYTEILFRKDIKANPILSQYNTIKYSLLVYRITWKIERKKIYSLITKCSTLDQYIQNSLSQYLEMQHHISQLYRFMTESIFHMTERKDSLDIMLEMNMENLLKHPVIVEVLNLAYEGKYSADGSALTLSQTFQSFFWMDTADLKSITDRLIFNIKSCGESGNGKQSNLQFNIWKQCIDQREQDEMILTVLFCLVVLYLNLMVDHEIASFFILQKDVYGQTFVNNVSIFRNSDDSYLAEFCPDAQSLLGQIDADLNTLFWFLCYACVGFLTAICQKILILQNRDNVELPFGRIFLELAIVVSSFLYVWTVSQDSDNPLIDEMCGIKDGKSLSKSYAIVMGEGENLGTSIQVVISLSVVFFSLLMILMLQRTRKLGELIMMVGQMIQELKKFLFTFSLVIIGFMVVTSQLKIELIIDKGVTFFETALLIFDGINGNQDFSKYAYPQGKIYIAAFAYLFNILLLSFLVSMFINRYRYVYKNIDALRRMDIIKLKNSSSYDKMIGGVTITFFPINIILLPFMLPMVWFKSERLNDFFLKFQYGFMILIFCCIAIAMAIPIFPLLYLKCLGNAIYILFHNRRENYKGQNFVNVFLAMLFNPVLILLSSVVDLFNLMNVLLKEEKGFEFKYQDSLESMDDYQIDQVDSIFTRIFYVNFEQTYQDKSTSFIDSMIQHRAIMRIVDNLHDLCCRGLKDYKQALENVQDYNLAKIFTRKCTVPHQSGDIKQGVTIFNILYAIQMDIELYNYIDLLFFQYRAGRLATHRQALSKEIKYKEEPKDTNKYRQNAGVSYLVKDTAPQGMRFQRDNRDFMNNFFVNIVARTFTNIEKVIQDYQEKNDDSRYKSTIKELEYIKLSWKEDLIKEAEASFQKFDHAYSTIRHNIKRKLNIRKATVSSFNMSPGTKQARERVAEPDPGPFMVSALTNHLQQIEGQDETSAQPTEAKAASEMKAPVSEMASPHSDMRENKKSNFQKGKQMTLEMPSSAL